MQKLWLATIASKEKLNFRNKDLWAQEFEYFRTNGELPTEGHLKIVQDQVSGEEYPVFTDSVYSGTYTTAYSDAIPELKMYRQYTIHFINIREKKNEDGQIIGYLADLSEAALEDWMINLNSRNEVFFPLTKFAYSATLEKIKDIKGFLNDI